MLSESFKFCHIILWYNCTNMTKNVQLLLSVRASSRKTVPNSMFSPSGFRTQLASLIYGYVTKIRAGILRSRGRLP